MQGSTYAGALLRQRMRSVAAAVRGRCLFVETDAPDEHVVAESIRRAYSLPQTTDLSQFPWVVVHRSLRTADGTVKSYRLPHNLRQGSRAFRALQQALAAEFGHDARLRSWVLCVRPRGPGWARLDGS